MTETEKVMWKVEIFRQCEDTEDFLKQKIEDIESQKVELKNLIEESKQVVAQYNDAVERIGRKVDVVKVKEQRPVTPAKKPASQLPPMSANS